MHVCVRVHAYLGCVSLSLSLCVCMCNVLRWMQEYHITILIPTSISVNIAADELELAFDDTQWKEKCARHCSVVQCVAMFYLGCAIFVCSCAILIARLAMLENVRRSGLPFALWDGHTIITWLEVGHMTSVGHMVVT